MSNEYKLVPVEPTPEMLRAGLASNGIVPVYTAMLAAAPQPPALGDDRDDALRDMASVACQSALSHGIGEHEFLKLARGVRQLVEAPLQAEIERLKCEIAAYKASRERLHRWIREEKLKNVHLKARCDELEGLLREVAALDPRGEFMGWQLDGRIDAALSKPAGSEQ